MDTSQGNRDAETKLRDDFMTAWNSHDEERVKGLFTADAVMTTPPIPGVPSTFTGLDEVRQAVQLYLPGFQGDLTGTQSQGDTIGFTCRVAADALRQMGIDSVDEVNELVYAGDKVKSFRIDFT